MTIAALGSMEMDSSPLSVSFQTVVLRGPESSSADTVCIINEKKAQPRPGPILARS